MRCCQREAPAVLATGSTDSLGNYTLSVANNTSIAIRVTAHDARRMAATPRWDMRVQDGAAGDNPYTFTDPAPFNSSAGTAHNVAIPSGINAAGTVTGTRASGAVRRARHRLPGHADRARRRADTNFPALMLDWGQQPGRRNFFDTGGRRSTSCCRPTLTEDTDEFDQHVIAHEFGHYIEYNFSRADNIGGAHGLGDKLDIRVAFGEGFGYAFSAIVLNDPVARDTFVDNGDAGLEHLQHRNESASRAARFARGKFRLLVQRVVGVVDSLGSLRQPGGCQGQRRAGLPAHVERADRCAADDAGVHQHFQFHHRAQDGAAPATPRPSTRCWRRRTSAPSADAYGTGETHFPTPVAQTAALPVYTPITVGGGAVQLLNVNDAGHYNTLGNHRFLRFTLAAPQTITITRELVECRRQRRSRLHRVPQWRLRAHRLAGSAAAAGNRDRISIPAGSYLLDVYDCANGCPRPRGTYPAITT